MEKQEEAESQRHHVCCSSTLLSAVTRSQDVLAQPFLRQVLPTRHQNIITVILITYPALKNSSSSAAAQNYSYA